MSDAIVPGGIKFIDVEGNKLDAVRTSAPTDAIVDAWFQANFHGLPISTDLFNRFQAAREVLKEQLRAVTQKE